jgi:hypothetical protein
MLGGLAGVIALGASVALFGGLAFGAPTSCHAPTKKPPFRGCAISVNGLLGRCRVHGRRAGYRMVVWLGGAKLAGRRICDKCGQRRVFGRLQDTGRAYLGCAGYPTCRNPRLLGSYRF